MHYGGKYKDVLSTREVLFGVKLVEVQHPSSNQLDSSGRPIFLLKKAPPATSLSLVLWVWIFLSSFLFV
jgi:hypothetical protein